MPKFVAPVNTAYTGRWGYYPSGKVHKAVDYPVPLGTAVRAAGNGVISLAGWSATGFGRHIRLKLDSNGHTVIYGHLYTYKVKAGQRVVAGQVIATADSSGNSTGNHVHMEMRKSSWYPTTSWDFTPYLVKWSTTDPGTKAVDRSSPIRLANLRPGLRNTDIARFEKAMWNWLGATWRIQNTASGRWLGDGAWGDITTNTMRTCYRRLGLTSSYYATYPGRTLLAKLGFTDIRN